MRVCGKKISVALRALFWVFFMPRIAETSRAGSLYFSEFGAV